MRSVFKYPISPLGTPVYVPEDAPIRLVDTQDGQVVVWIEVETTDAAPPEPRVFLYVGTGHEVPDNVKHVGSCQSPSGFVWHAYEATSV